MSGRYVIVHRTYDPIQADLLGDILRDAGIAARVTGTRSGAAIGVAQNILEVSLAVPEEQAGQATDFLEAYFSGEGQDPAEDLEAAALAGALGSGAAALGDDEDDDEYDLAAAARDEARRPLLAAGAAFVTFGMGHFYARRPFTAAALAAGQAVAMYFLFAGTRWDHWTTGITMLGGVVACDLVGAVLASRAHNRGVRRGPAWQLGVGTACAAGAIGLAMLVGPTLADPSKGARADEEAGPRPASPRELERLDHPLERDPTFPPLTNQHPGNPQAR